MKNNYCDKRSISMILHSLWIRKPRPPTGLQINPSFLSLPQFSLLYLILCTMGQKVSIFFSGQDDIKCNTGYFGWLGKKKWKVEGKIPSFFFQPKATERRCFRALISNTNPEEFQGYFKKNKRFPWKTIPLNLSCIMISSPSIQLP